MELEFCFVMGERVNTKFLYVVPEKQLYTKNGVGKNGDIFRCADRKCKARRYLKENKCVKFSSSFEHNHSDDCESRFTKLRALERMKTIASDLNSVAPTKTDRHILFRTSDVFGCVNQSKTTSRCALDRVS